MACYIMKGFPKLSWLSTAQFKTDLELVKLI